MSSDALVRPAAVPSRSAAAPRTGPFLLLMLVLGGLVPIPLLLMPDSGRGSAWMLTWALLVWSAFRLSQLIALAQPRLFAFIWWTFVYVFMGLAPTVQLLSNDLPTTTQGMDPAWDTPTARVVWLGVLMWEVGAFFARGRRVDDELGPDLVDLNYPAAHRRARFVALVGLVMALYFISSMGLGTLFTSREGVEDARLAIWPDPSTNSIVFAMSTYLCLVGALAIRLTATARLGLADRLLVLTAATLAVVCANPVGSARYVAGTVLMSLAALLGAFASQRRTQISLIGGVFSLLFLFPVADAFRYTAVSTSRDGFFGEYAGNGDYDAFAQISNSLQFVHDGFMTWGNQLLGVLFFWVPRRIWADKPIDTGILLADYRGYTFSNLSAPLWSEAIVNFGIVGVVVLFAAIGYLLTNFDRKGAQALINGSGYWAVLAGTIPFYGMIILRGSLLQATGGLAILVLALVIVRPFRTRSPRRGTATGPASPADAAAGEF